ncbi:LPXTG cell wall anchor domain-containing protein, partial [Catellatospora methionotrophica]|uniref:LPXTG cell wall anchor domain-containing protein n=1 Tax=Catellatospora methionotrophica TaxID=121620 RepID=UPI0033EE3C50
MKDALVPVLVVIGLLLLAGLTLFLVRRPRRGALPPTEQPRPGIERGEQVPPSVITAPAPEKAPERVTPTKPTVPAPAPP